MMRVFTCFIITLVLQTTGLSQSLPSQWKISDDGKFLIAGTQASTGLYDESKVETIKLYFSQPNFWNLLMQNYNSKTDLATKLVYKGISYDSVGVRFKGQTSYFANPSQKKSFNISMDAFKDDINLEGFKTVNLNNSFEDPSFMREVLYYKLIRPHSHAAKANFVRLYINDVDWGIYLNVQQLNKDFLEEWYENNDGTNIRADRPDGSSFGPGGPGGQWGDGTTALNYLGPDSSIYKTYYTIKSGELNNPWQELIKACNILNFSGLNLEAASKTVFDIDKILWHLACEIAFTDDDSYVFKGRMDYYLYQDADTKRWATYDYDANSTFSTGKISTWSPFYNENKVNYPLLNKLLAIPAFRQRYLAHMRTILKTSFDESKVATLIDAYDSLIRSAVLVDTKKVTSALAFNNGLTELKNFIKNRKAYLLSNVEVSAPAPTISDAKYSVNKIPWSSVTANSDVVVSATVRFSDGLQAVNLYYSQKFTGMFSSIPMLDNGTGNDLVSGDGIYTATLPKSPSGSLVRMYVEAIGNDAVKTRSYYPEGAEHELMIYRVNTTSLAEKSVVVNEFMASNGGVIKDDAGQNDDWIELFNNSDKDINLGGFFITDNPDNLTKFKFPTNTIIKAKDYLILWADEDQTQGPLHCNFKLSAGGEVIILSDSSSAILDSVAFGTQVADKSAARIPNGTGNFTIGNHTFGKNNNIVSSAFDATVSHLRIFPNPTATGLVHVENMTDNTEILEIIGINGTKIAQYTLPAKTLIDLQIEQRGVFLLKTKREVKKLIVTD
jgi:spore coat protein CotH